MAMGTIRQIQRVAKSKPTIEGAGVHLKRAFGFHDVRPMDPFLLLDDFHSANPDDYLPGFPWHPHRGIETITYMLEGEVDHGDSMGNSGVIHAGDVQWMTAGSGINHQEMPRGPRDGRMWGFQLWANLPASHKMMDPRYRGVTGGEIPRVETPDGASVRIICGQVAGVSGPVHDVITQPEYLDVTVPASSRFSHPVAAGHTAIAYVIDGAACFDERRDAFAYEVEGRNWSDLERDCRFGPETLILFGDGDEIAVTTEEKPVRFLLMSGRPIREPIAWYGPIVMNTQDELRKAFQEFQDGTFVKVKGR
jgi:redox-sensitive bicupin YhaK (pirin superfamily)